MINHELSDSETVYRLLTQNNYVKQNVSQSTCAEPINKAAK